MLKRELEAEVERLRAQVAFLTAQQAAHVCPQWPTQPGWPLPGQIYIGDVPPYSGWINTCGAAAVPQTVIMTNAAGANPPLMFTRDLGVGAGAAAQPLLQTLWVNT